MDTAKGTKRRMASVSNLPIAILEMDQAKAKRLNMTRLLTLYIRAPLQTRANRSHDLTANTLRFRGALVFVQNVEQFSGEAQKGRVVSLPFRKEAQNRNTLKNLLKPQSLPPGRLAAYRHAVLTRRREFQQVLCERFRHCASYFQTEGIEYTRVGVNRGTCIRGGKKKMAVCSLPVNSTRARCPIQERDHRHEGSDHRGGYWVKRRF